MLPKVPGTKGTYEYAFIFSYLVPGASIYQLSGPGCTTKDTVAVAKTSDS